MKRRTYLVALASTTALAGCTGVSPPSRGDGSGSDQSPTTSSEDVVQYRDLSDEGKNVFEALLETSLYGPESDFPTDIWRAEYVVYEGTLYTIERDQTGDYIAEHSLHTEFVNETAIEDDADVIAFEELTPIAQDIFEASRFGEGGESLGDPSSHFGRYDYVRYEGDYYRVATLVADIPEWELSATKADR